MDESLKKVRTEADIIPLYRGTPVAELLAYQNLGASHRHYTEAELLIGMCMDHRLQLRIPSNFAFVLRCAGANLRRLEFDVSFAIAVGGARCICLIGHDECRMVELATKRKAFVTGLVDGAGWERRKAEAQFDGQVQRYGFGDVVEFLGFEAQRLRDMYAGIIVAPLVYSTADQSLGQIINEEPSVETVHQAVEVGRGEQRL